MNFHAGQKIVCVNSDQAPQLILGGVYTVKQVLPVALRRWIAYDIKGAMAAVTVREAEPAEGCEGFYLGRFKPAVRRPTNIEVFTKILKKHSKKTHA